MPRNLCPRCGSPVRESKQGYFCNSRPCDFKLWKESKFWTMKCKPLAAAIAATLLKDGRVKLTGLFSEKTGKICNATVILKDTGGKFVDFEMEFAPIKERKWDQGRVRGLGKFVLLV